MVNSSRKPVAFFFPSFSGGGAEKVMVEIANEFRNRSHQVDVVVLSTQGPYLINLDPGVRLVDLDSPSMMRCIYSLARYIKKERPEIIMSTGLHTGLSLILASLVSRTRTRLASREALPLSIEMRQSWLLYILTRLLYSRFDVYISPTECQLKIRHTVISTRNKAIECVIPNPLDYKKIYKMSKQKPKTEIKGLPATVPYIVSCGRLVEQKNYLNLLEAFAVVRKEVECKLVILGDGALRKEIENRIYKLNLNSDVFLPGFLDNPHPIVAGASAYVQTSLFEGMPNSLLHAFALGVPCISTDCQCGPSEIFSQGRHGKLVPLNDSDAMAAAILNVLRSSNIESDVSNITSLYSLNQVCSKYESALMSDSSTI